MSHSGSSVNSTTVQLCPIQVQVLTAQLYNYVPFRSFVNFLIPLVVLIVCYTRIFLKIAQKASENKNNQLNKRQSFKPGKVSELLSI